jgi:hypothetical protein
LCTLLVKDDHLLASGEWDELLRLATKDAPLLDALVQRRSDLAGRGWSTPGWDGWAAIDGTRVGLQHPQASARERLLDGILQTDRSTLTRSQLHDLHGLTSLGGDRPARVYSIDSAVDAATMAERVGEGRSISDAWIGWRMLDEAPVAAPIPSNADERAAWIAEGLAERAASGTTTDALRLVLGQRHDLLPSARGTRLQLAVAAETLLAVGSDRYPTPAEVRPMLAAARDALDQVSAQAGDRAPIVSNARELVDRNLARIDGELLGTGDGHLTYPDYADLGRIAGSLKLLERLGADAADPAILRW